MKAVSIIYALPVLLLVSCGQGNNEGEKKIISVEKKEVLKEPAKVFPNQTMTVQVKGMSCEHSCGGSIRMALKETGAVDRCSFDFKEDRPENTATITYDDKKINPKKIINIIETINDKQFTTSNHSVKPIQAEAKTEKAKEQVSVKETSEALPQKTQENDIAVSSGGGSMDYSGVVHLFSFILTIQ